MAGLKKIAVGEILADAWRLYSQHFGSIVAIVAVIWAPLELLSSYMNYFIFGPDDFRKSFQLAQILDTFVGIIAVAGVISFGQTVLSRERAAAGTSLFEGLKAWWRIWLARFFSRLFFVVGLLLLVLPGFYVLVRACLAETIAVCERRPGRDAVRRSFELTEGRFWEIFLVGLTLTGFAIVVVTVVFLPTALFPALDHWLVDAATNLVADIAVAFGTLCFLCVYRKLTDAGEKLRIAEVFE